MQIVNESEYNYFYELYLIDQEYEERVHSFICESILNEEYLIEGEKWEAIKAFVQKIIDAIKENFRKFTEKLKDLFSKDEDYFKKYKDVIQTVAPIKANITNFYEYNIDKIRNSKLPKLDIEKMKKYASEIDFIKAAFPDFVPSNDQKFTDKVKEVFRGGEAKTVNAAELSLKPMHDYINGYDKLTTIMEKDIAMIDDAGAIVKLKFKMTKNSGASPVKKEKIKDESFSFQDTMNYYFTEEENNNQNQSSGGTTKIETQPANNTNAQAQSGASSTAKKVDPNTINNNQKDSENQSTMNDADQNEKDAQKQAAEDERKQKEAEAKEEEENEKATKMYFNVCSQFLGMRFAMAQEAYSTYSKIIKWHVDQWVKDHDGDRSGKVKKTKNTDKVTKDTKFYYCDDKGDWYEVTPKSNKDAKMMADPNYEYKAEDGKTYKLSRTIDQTKTEDKEDDKDKFKTNPITIYFLDDEGNFAKKPNGKPRYKKITSNQQYADYFKPGAKFTFDGDPKEYRASKTKVPAKPANNENKNAEENKAK